LGARRGDVIVRRRVTPFLRERIADVTRNRAAGAVETALIHPLLQRLDRRRRRVVLDRRRLRDRVRLDTRDARTIRQHALDHRLLGGVVKAADVQDGGDRSTVRGGLPVRVSVVAFVLVHAQGVLLKSPGGTSPSYHSQLKTDQSWICAQSR